ncbi:DUF4309 domain-containing protein [Paenibacillus aestuarii]|uniref:DUF4309 domain-containing protein n=1 Tax=Paenibacillus aestuarii TaxID=516965 RepID=A0ABW0KGB3_9BACL|nr:DUF4309 domain-containing protein [Paenibacillus aestuarii]
MNKLTKLLVLGCVPVALVSLVAAGCQKSSVPTAQPPLETPTYIQTVVHETKPPVEPAPTQAPSPTPEDQSKHEAQVAGTTKTDLSDIPQTANNPKPTAKPKVKSEDAYQQDKPTLMGLKLGTSKDFVLKRFGTAKKQFNMDEDQDTLQVYDYTDFSVGFNAQDALQFVDVRSFDIDPGLQGLHLGQKVQDAIAILGKPDSNSTYVLSYKAQGTILRLDIDPKAGTIQSIKLFADE